jgi:hypothetical protein
VSNPYKITLQLPAAVANGIALSQSRGSAGALTINGSLATGGVATLSSANCPARRVQIVSAGNDSALVWTITGLNRYGLVHSETLAGANAGAANSVKDYATVTSIVSSGATASTVTAGTNGVASTEWRVQDFFREKFSVACYIGISGVANCQVEYTADDPNAALPGSLLPNSNQPPVAYLHGTLNNLSMNATGNFNDLPAFAIRLTVNSGTGAVTMTLIQSGIGS